MTDTELALLVAKAAGIEVFEDSGGTLWRGPRPRNLVGKPLRQWMPLHPTLGWSDAMEAAEKVGLFAPDGHCMILGQCNSTSGVLHYVEPLEEIPGEAITHASGPRALCEAIVATKGDKS